MTSFENDGVRLYLDGSGGGWIFSYNEYKVGAFLTLEEINPFEISDKLGRPASKIRSLLQYAAKEIDKEEGSNSRSKNTNSLAWQIAEALLQNNRYATLGDTEEVLRYEEGVYVAGGETLIKSKIQEILDKVEVDNHLCEEVIGHVKRSTYTNRRNFDADPNYLLVENIIINLETFEATPLNPDYLSRVKLPVKYDPKADCPKIKKFLEDVMYREDISVYQEWVGFCLRKRYEAQKALLLVGDGANGKSTALAILRSLLGSQNISSRSLQDLENNRFAKADLYGKLANIYADLPDSSLKSTGTFKMITGGDAITAEYKFRNGFPFVPYAKQTFSCNKIPEVPEDTTAFFRRWIILTFPNIFQGDKENKNLLKELTTPEELSGFLNWALEGLKRLKANNWNFSNSKSVEEIRREYVRKSSPIRAFLMDCTLQNPAGYEAKQGLYDAFATYCRENKLPIVTQHTFFQNLPMFVPVTTTRPELGGKRVWCIQGLTLRDENDWGEDGEEYESSGTNNRENGGHSGQTTLGGV